MTETVQNCLRIKLPKNNHGFSRFLALTFAILFGAMAGGSAWAQNIITTFTMNSDPAQVTPAFEDSYALGSNNGVEFFAVMLRDANGTGNKVTRTLGGQTYYKLQNNDIDQSHFKIQFNPGVIKAGDILTISCTQVWGNAGTVGYRLGGSDATESDDVTASGVANISHTIAANEIIKNEGGDKEFIRIGRINGDTNSAYNTFTITRNVVTYDYNGGTGDRASAEFAAGSYFQLPYPTNLTFGDAITTNGTWTRADGGTVGTYGGITGAYEAYKADRSFGNEEILTQTIDVENGIYEVKLLAAASFTPDRGVTDCHTGDWIAQAFANNSLVHIPIVERIGVPEANANAVTLVATVTDGHLKFGLRNNNDGGNWYVVRLESIKKCNSDPMFTGWYTAAEGGTKIGDGGQWVTLPSSQTLYAHWENVEEDRGVVIGNLDNTSAFNVEKSDVFEIQKNKVREFSFINYRADNTNNYDSWVLGVNNENAAATNVFLLNLFPQVWHGGTAVDTYLYNKTSSTVSTAWSDADWTTFRSDMNGAQVDVKISLSNDGKIVHTYATMTNNGRTYLYSYTETMNAALNAVYAYFTIEHAHLEHFEEVANPTAYAFESIIQIDIKVKNGDNMTNTYNACGNVDNVQFKDVAGNVIPKGTLLSVGEVITWTGAATANDGYTFARWNPATTLTVNKDARVRAVFTKDEATDYTKRMFNNRITAEWNLVDDFTYQQYKSHFKFRLETDKLNDAKSKWTKSADGKTYTYKEALSNQELTYDGTLTFPLTAGLKFTAKANDIQIVLNKAGSDVEYAYLVLKTGVEVTIPQLKNTNGGANKDKRDLLYMITDMTANNGSLTCLGPETMNGSTYFKFDFNGNAAYTFKTTKETKIKRIIVNRNFVTSNFIEHDGQTTFTVGEKVVGVPEGTVDGASYLNNAPGVAGSGYITYPKSITMTYGGWIYGKYVEKTGSAGVNDEWGKVEDYTGYSDHRIPIVTQDGFYHFSQGKQNAKSELMNYEAATYYHPSNGGQYSVPAQPQTPRTNVTPWTIPCRGTYVKYEPTQPGVLHAYIFQNGCLDYEGNDFTGKIAWRPHYVVDEAGAIVPGVIAKTSALNAQGPDYDVTYNGTRYTIENSGLTAEQITFLRNSSWKGQKEGDKEDIIPAPDGGFLVMTKAYVEYTFNVLPGKTYYIFSNGSKLGNVGFIFEPGVETTDGETMSEVHFAANRTYNDALTTKYTAPTATEKAVNITVNRSFTANKWSTICLPYSMNNVQMKEQFGDDFRVVLLRDIQPAGGQSGEDKNTAHFIYHVNQDIIAGYPYLIYPSKNVTSFSSNATLTAGISKPVVSISGTGQSIAKGSIYGNDYEGFDCFTFEGNYERTTLPQGSYVVTNDGKLTRLNQSTEAKPFRAFIKFVGDGNSGPVEIKAVNFGLDEIEEMETSIDDVLFEQGIFTEKADVYNLKGQMVRAKAESIQDLPKGIYIVNGKKVMVK